MKEMYVVEPRHPDGTLNVRGIYECAKVFRVEGVTEREIFEWYWRHRKDEDATFSEWGYGENSSWEQVKALLKSKGWYMRKKTW